MKTWLSILIMAMLIPQAQSAEPVIEGVTLPARRGHLSLQGGGLLRKGFIFKIYVGALYLEKSEDAVHLLERVPKRIDIHYLHHTPKKYMIGAAEKALKNNLSADELKRLRPQIDRLHDAYMDGEKGACASLVYRPDKGLTYLFDGKEILTLPNDDFANAYLTVWLGKQPASETMKSAMLGDV